MSSSMRSQSTAPSEVQPQDHGGLPIGPIGALFGASVGVVLAALVDVSAPLLIDGAAASSWVMRGWLIGALVGAVSGYMLGALIAWELAGDPNPDTRGGHDGPGLEMDALEPLELPSPPGERHRH